MSNRYYDTKREVHPSLSRPISDGCLAPDSPERALHTRVSGPTAVDHSLDRERCESGLLLFQSERRPARYAREGHWRHHGDMSGLDI